MRLIMLNIYAQHRGALCSVVLSSPRWLLDIQPSTLCLLSSSYFPCSSLNTHLLSLLPPGKFDSWVLCAKNGHTRTSVITPNIYISSSTYLFFFFHPLLFLPSVFLCLCAADGRLNTGHAGVLLVERRGSYPLIDLRILKSKSPDSFKHETIYINWPCQ